MHTKLAFAAILLLIGVPRVFAQGTPLAAAPVEYWPLLFKGECILKVVAERKGLYVRDDIPAPKVYFKSQTPLEVYQDAMEKAYKTRPKAFVNAYVYTENIIFLDDDPMYYTGGRTMEDALAHEYVHFLQLKYEGASPKDYDLVLEPEAIDIQLWFRDEYMHWDKPRDPCCDGGCEPESIDGYHVEDPPRKGHYEVYSPDGWHIEYHFVPHEVEEYSPDGYHIEYH